MAVKKHIFIESKRFGAQNVIAKFKNFSQIQLGSFYQSYSVDN